MIGGAFLHFGVLAYLIVVPVLVLVSAPANTNADQVVSLGLRLSAMFLTVFVAAAVVAVGFGALIDWRQNVRDWRSEGADARLSRKRLELSVATIGRQFAAARNAAGTIAARDWQHDEERYQSISRDLASVAASGSAAWAKSSDAQQAAIVAQLLRSLAHIDAALAELDAERAAAAHRQAEATALYVQRRYGDPDFAIKPD